MTRAQQNIFVLEKLIMEKFADIRAAALKFSAEFELTADVAINHEHHFRVSIRGVDREIEE